MPTAPGLGGQVGGVGPGKVQRGGDLAGDRDAQAGQLSNNPDKGAQLARLGITIARQVPTALHLTGTNAAYLATKALRGGHDLLSPSFEHAAGPRRPAGPLSGPADLGFQAR